MGTASHGAKEVTLLAPNTSVLLGFLSPQRLMAVAAESGLTRVTSCITAGLHGVFLAVISIRWPGLSAMVPLGRFEPPTFRLVDKCKSFVASKN